MLSLLKSNLVVKVSLLLGLFVYSEYSHATLFCLFNWNACHRYSPRKYKKYKKYRNYPQRPYSPRRYNPGPQQNPFQPYTPDHSSPSQPGPQGYDFYDAYPRQNPQQRPEAPERLPMPRQNDPRKSQPPAPQPPSANPPGSVELALANAVKKAGGKSVQGQFDPQLCNIIKPYAEKLARQNYQDGHKGMEQRSQQAFRLGNSGASEITAESWGWEKSLQASADSCVESWLQSPGHKKAMMGSHKKYCYTMAKSNQSKPNRGAPYYCVGFFAD